MVEVGERHSLVQVKGLIYPWHIFHQIIQHFQNYITVFLKGIRLVPFDDFKQVMSISESLFALEDVAFSDDVAVDA